MINKYPLRVLALLLVPLCMGAKRVQCIGKREREITLWPHARISFDDKKKLYIDAFKGFKFTFCRFTTLRNFQEGVERMPYIKQKSRSGTEGTWFSTMILLWKGKVYWNRFQHRKHVPSPSNSICHCSANKTEDTRVNGAAKSPQHSSLNRLCC